MGATFAVRLAQAASLTIIRKSGLLNSLVNADNSNVIKGLHGRVIVYIDDITVIGTVASGLNRSTTQIIRTFADQHLPDAEDKRQVAPLSGPGEALGLWWWPEGYLTVKPQLAHRLLCETEQALERGYLSSSEMRHLLGLWIWPCLLRRGLLSVMDSSFTFITEPDPERRRRLPRSLRVELNMLLDLFPLMFADLHMNESTRVYASDASPQGGGVGTVTSPRNGSKILSRPLARPTSRKVGIQYYSVPLATMMTGLLLVTKKSRLHSRVLLREWLFIQLSQLPGVMNSI